MELSIIIVSHNHLEYLKDCIDSIQKFIRDLYFEIIIVDNCSTQKGIDSYLEKISGSNSNIKYIKNKENIGFAPANNRGAAVSEGKYLAFLNPDTVLLNNSFRIMLDFIENESDAGICGPRLFNPDMSFQVSFYSFPSLSKNFLKVIGVNKLINRNPDLFKWAFKFSKLMPRYANIFGKNFTSLDVPTEVPWVTGACLMIKKDVFDGMGRFDENFILYAEDIDLCLRIRKKGMKYSIIWILSAR